jgi:uncharacterized protein YhaN
MRINKLDIKGFGKYNNYGVEFDRGFNIVYGSNESGKSTMQAFIKAMFYSLRGGRNLKGEVYTPLNKYKPWDGREYKGSLVYTLDNGQVYIVERNFQKGETKIYDSLYRDITKTFDQSKDKGPLFAIKHFGLTEACFEKTLYIGQMATKIDNNDKKEIINSLANISETGSEDISYVNASKAIKEALKIYVGTDKTSTRPLDIINSNLIQLKDKSQNLLKSKESLIFTEEEIAVLNNKKLWLEELKTVIKLSKDIVNVREEIDDYKKRKKDISDIIYEISTLNEECDNLKKSIGEYENSKELFESYSGFGFDETDELYIKYSKYESLKEENSRLLAELDNLRRSAAETKNLIEELKAFELYNDLNLGDSALGNELSVENANKASILTEIKAAQFKNKALATVMAAAFLSMSALLLYSFINSKYFYIAGGAVPLIIFIISAIFKFRNSKLLNLLKDEEYQANKKIKSLFEETEKQKSLQEELFRRLKVNSVDELLRKKILYDSKTYELNSQIKRINELEEIYEKNCTVADEILEFIKQRLLICKIINSLEVNINKEHIEAFRTTISKYKETVANLNSREDKLNVFYKQIDNLYIRANSICGQKIKDISELTDILKGIEKKIENLYENLDIYAYKIKAIFANNQFEGINYDKLMEILLDLRIEDTKRDIEEITQKVFDGLSSTQVILKEKELALSSLNDDNNELERIEEEIREQELKKDKLEEIGFSLKTALEVLEESNTEIKRDFAPIVNKNASKLIGLITDNRYAELKVDEDLVLRTMEPYLKDIVHVSALSGGTVEQMYLALRIALVQTIEKNSEKLPLLLDEVLSQYDDSRSLKTIGMLRDISDERQIIFFTCKLRDVEMVKSVCNNNVNIIKLK